MCYMVYIGSDTPLPTSQWDEKSPEFFLSDCEDSIKEVKKHFSKKYIYYAGAHTNCGCGFFYNEEYHDQDEIEQERNSVRKLIRMLELALESRPNVELIVAWAGEEDKPPKRKMKMTPGRLLDKNFPLEEGDFVIFSKAIKDGI